MYISCMTPACLALTQMVADNTLIVYSFHIVSISNEGMKEISKKNTHIILQIKLYHGCTISKKGEHIASQISYKHIEVGSSPK
jgi:hypothetical protein